VRDQIHSTARFHAIDDLIDNLLNARAHVLDASGSKGADYKTTQAAMVGRIELQHPVAHAAIYRLLENLWPGSPGHSADEIFAEAFVAQDLGDVRMSACNIQYGWREMAWVGHARSMIEGRGFGNEFRRPWVEQRCALGRLKLLVYWPPLDSRARGPSFLVYVRRVCYSGVHCGWR